jgi:23S rRNA (adenine2030-N6)-methyltransferase
MNYHHIYHAGNFADIFKHTILCLCLEKFHEKPTPFFVLDTHAGIGKYNLSDEKSLKTFEAEEGIKKIFNQPNFLDILPPRYLTILAKTNRCEIDELPEKLKTYAGSPIIIKDYLRSQDRAIFAELNREDFAELKRHFAGNPKFSLTREDGFHLLSSKLPPLEKRGLVIIDPAFEKDQELISPDYEKTILALKEGYKRFSHGTYLIWHPIIDKAGEEKVLKNFYKEIAALPFQKIIHITFGIGKKHAEETKMSACGMFVINAVWQLDERLGVILPKVLEVIGNGDGAGFETKIIRNN